MAKNRLQIDQLSRKSAKYSLKSTLGHLCSKEVDLTAFFGTRIG